MTDTPADPSALPTRIILASASAARQKMLRDAEVPHEVIPSDIDEDVVRQRMFSVTRVPTALADAIADSKAVAVAVSHRQAMVIGSDQVLAVDGGMLLDKPRSPEEAKEHLKIMSGRTHELHSAAVVVENSRNVWRASQVARLRMRTLSEEFIDQYVGQHWETICNSVGCYQIEGAGAQLFHEIHGDPYVIMGMPLLPLLHFLREREVIAR